MKTQLNLRAVFPPLIEQAIRGFEEGNVGSFLISSCHQGGPLALVADNFPLLKRRGIFEKCLLSAYTSTRTNLHQWSPSVLEKLFDYADRQELRAAGEPVPAEPNFRVYRGIAGDRYRRPRGYSWTLSLDVGCWFATRFDLANPCVLAAKVNNDEVLAFTDSRNEQEVIVRPTKYQNLKLPLAEIEEGAQREHEAKLQRYEEMKVELHSKIQEAKSTVAL